MATLLSRLDALESSPEREATRDEDRKALETLAARGFDAAERARLADLVRRAQTAVFPTELPVAEESSNTRQEALRELRAWYEDWPETARAVIKRRDLLILLGLAHRRRSDPDEVDETTSEISAVSPEAAQ